MRRTTITVDEKLIEEARKLTGLKTNSEVIDFALRDLVRRKGQRKLLALKGHVQWEGDLCAMRRIDRL